MTYPDDARDEESGDWQQVWDDSDPLLQDQDGNAHEDEEIDLLHDDSGDEDVPWEYADEDEEEVVVGNASIDTADKKSTQEATQVGGEHEERKH